MTDIDTPLKRCFISVFPALGGTDVTRAELTSVEGWDSIATATLLSVVCEEFDLPMDPDETESLTSYGGFRAWIVSRIGQTPD